MKVVKEILALSVQFLEKNHINRPRLTAELLLAHFLKLKRIELYLHFDRPLEEEELVPFRASLKRAITHEPIEYILGEKEFYHVILKVSPAVLIPRQETEILLDTICEKVNGRVLDLCTGSGCLAIGLKKAKPHLDVVGIDLSKEALKIARYNAEQNGVEIQWLEGDLTEPVKGEKFDVVVCNPPYVRVEDFDGLEKSVRDYEPKMALVSGPSGYEFFERLNRELPPILNAGAQVFFEIGSGQKEGVLEIFSQGPWEDLKVEPDWAGHDRFFFLKMKDFSSILESSNYV